MDGTGRKFQKSLISVLLAVLMAIYADRAYRALGAGVIKLPLGGVSFIYVQQPLGFVLCLAGHVVLVVLIAALIWVEIRGKGIAGLFTENTVGIFVFGALIAYSGYQMYEGLTTGVMRSIARSGPTWVEYADSPGGFIFELGLYFLVLLIGLWQLAAILWDKWMRKSLAEKKCASEVSGQSAIPASRGHRGSEDSERLARAVKRSRGDSP